MKIFGASSRRGFTLIEVLVTVVIIALLASVVYASLGDARKKAQDAQRSSDLQQIQVAIRVYRDANNKGYPASSGEVVVSSSGVGALIAQYLSGTVGDPTGGSYYYADNFDCNGTSRTILVAEMGLPQNGNWETACGGGNIAGFSPTANTYVLILK